LADGLEVRGTSRSEESLAPIRATGIEPALADPLWPGTVLDLVGDVAVVLWALGSAHTEAGEGGSVEAIHGDRLERLLERLVETPVRGFVYEASGSVDAEVLETGVRAVDAAAARWRIPAETVVADASNPERWVEEMAAAAARLIG